jgi:hypothetical protein
MRNVFEVQASDGLQGENHNADRATQQERSMRKLKKLRITCKSVTALAFLAIITSSWAFHFFGMLAALQMKSLYDLFNMTCDL